MLLIYAGSCQCKEGFHGNGTENCIPDGFDEEANGKHYKMFDDKYVEFEEAVDQCEDLGARYFRYYLQIITFPKGTFGDIFDHNI